MLGCSSLTLSILAACASMELLQHMMTTRYCPRIQEHSSLFVSRQSKYSRTVHGTSIKCRSSTTRCIHRVVDDLHFMDVPWTVREYLLCLDTNNELCSWIRGQ